VCFYGFKNIHKKYFLPSTENYFSIVKVPFLLIDTGCNTILSLKEGDIEALVNEYPKKTFGWSVRRSRGVGILNCLTLSIESWGKNFKCKLDYFEFEMNHLRFDICYDDALILINHVPAKELSNWIREVEKLRKLFPDKKIAERKSYSLLGQSVLDNYYCHQLQNIFFTTQDININIVETLSKIAEKKTLMFDLLPNFNDLYDEKHDDDGDLVDSSVDWMEDDDRIKTIVYCDEVWKGEKCKRIAKYLAYGENLCAKHFAEGYGHLIGKNQDFYTVL